MTARSWLPAPCEGEVEAAVAAFASRWLGDWIAGPIDVRATSIPATGQADSCAERGDRVALGLAACAGQADAGRPGDAAILEVIGDAMLADLSAALGDGAAGALRFRLEAADGSWRVAFALDEEAVAGLRKVAAGSARRPVVAPLADALADEDVRLGCHLGAARLTAADLSALAQGDLIVLDRALEADVPLTIEGAICRAGQASIGAKGNAISVTLTEPPDLFRRN